MTLREAYKQTMAYLRTTRHAYQLTFGNGPGQEVLMDLAKFCRATETTFHADPRIHAALEGRREVWLRIQQHLHYTPDELYDIFGGHPVNLTTLTEEDDA